MKYIWLTRPQEDSEALAAALGIPTIIAPVIRIAPRTIADFGEKPEGLVITSRHALPADLPDDWRHLPVYCVGEATATAALAAGFPTVIEGGGDALLLASRIADLVPPGTSLLYLSGEDIRVNLPTLLTARHIPVRSLVTYDAVAEPALTEHLAEAIRRNEVTGAVFFSARSATIAIGLMQQANVTRHASAMTAYCISVAAAEAAGALSWHALKVAATPSFTAMVELIRTSGIEAA